MNTDIALFVLRVGAGAGILTHGIPKLLGFSGTMKWIRSEGFPLPVLSTLGVTAAETIGALMLILGVYVQWAALVLAFSILVALLFHLKKHETFKQMEDAFVYFLVCLVLAIGGAGAWALMS